ncbi:MAG TPA: lysylphosphatidylglycerol synthase transmembrane domain-containing protein, partial [Chitinophagaceae bacterium]|nr:lysylphosphatidylglycerol synthase transmembrane domain-containing protein [Chitinophagaceae bacterium]
MNKKIRTIIQFVLFLSIGVFLGWLSLKNLKPTDISQIKTAIRQARHWLLIPVSLLLFTSHFVRALRWRLLIEPLGHLPTRANTFFAVMIGYFANQAFPRLGEVLKCTVLARYEKIPADKLIGTMVLERIVDGLTLLIIIGITLAIQPGLYSQLIDTFLHSPKDKEGNTIPGWIIVVAVVFILLLVLAIWMIRKKKNFSDLVSFFRMIWKHVWEGIGA